MKRHLDIALEAIDIIKTTDSIDALNSAYLMYINAGVNMWEIDSAGLEQPFSDRELEILDHITNYNIVRIASDNYDKLSRPEMKTLSLKCISSFKGDLDKYADELSLIDNLYNELS